MPFLREFMILRYMLLIQEADLVRQIEQLKQEKINCTQEIPDIKKDLEKCREDYDNALKRDKEIDKQFKKEFHVYETYFEALSKLFRRRSVPNEATEIDSSEQDLNPFAAFEKEIAAVEMNPVALNQSVDMPDGLGQDLWVKLVDIRDRKIFAEQEVIATGKAFKELQSLVQSLLEESDLIKVSTEKCMEDLSNFLDFKFRNIYNIEILFGVKQGQVEVPQAPIVTDYSDAALLHRSVVESLNEQVCHLGQLKVDALTEMKNYRKGIHALEW